MHRLGHFVAWTLGSCLLIVILAYLAIVAINWSDEPPSADAQALTRIVAERPVVADKDNAFVLFLGLPAPKTEDPFVRGQAHNQFLKDLAPWKPGDDGPYFPGLIVQYRASRAPAITAIAEACRKGDADCVRLVHAEPEQVTRWLASESWLLARYTRLIQLHQWRETIPKDSGAPTPSYMRAMDGQMLLLMQAWQHARMGEGDASRALLQQDLAFWRMVLRASDTVITKMIATSAIERNFALGNLALRALHDAGQPATPPALWQTPVSMEERSMQRPFAGEWRVLAGSMGPLAELFGTDRLGDWLKRPMFKVQATNNLYASRFLEVDRRLNVDYRRLPQATRAQAPEPQCGKGLHRAYNFVGCVFNDIGSDYPYTDYGVRVSDLEGERRATLLALELRGAGSDAMDAGERIQSSSLRNPYTGKPFEWEPATRSIVFKGLAKGTQARHAVLL